MRALLETASLNADVRRQLLFHRHFEERMMGLLGALIPDVSKVLQTFLAVATDVLQLFIYLNEKQRASTGL